jgi:hypothetical protein
MDFSGFFQSDLNRELVPIEGSHIHQPNSHRHRLPRPSILSIIIVVFTRIIVPKSVRTDSYSISPLTSTLSIIVMQCNLIENLSYGSSLTLKWSLHLITPHAAAYFAETQ